MLQQRRPGVGRRVLGGKLGTELTSDSLNHPRTQAAQQTTTHPKLFCVTLQTVVYHQGSQAWAPRIFLLKPHTTGAQHSSQKTASTCARLRKRQESQLHILSSKK